MGKFNLTFNYKVMYIMRINMPTHTGLLKIGDTTIETEVSADKLFPNSSALNKVARDRIKQYTNTAGISFELLHTEIAIKTGTNTNGEPVLLAFRDKEVHAVLENSGYAKIKIGTTTGNEWFRIGVKSAVEAIAAVKNNQKFIEKNKTKDEFVPISFRPEQKEAIRRTLKQFKNSNRMLWNAKMRFGKTLSALEVVKQMEFKKTIIVTHRPVVNDGWYEDFNKIFYNTDEYLFGSKAKKIKITDLEESCKHYVYFASVQDLRGSDKVGGKFDKNNDIFNVNWDLVVVDEAHEGTKTSLGENVVNELISENDGYTTKFLALSGTPFNIVHEYKEEELYTWDYIMEQKAKEEWTVNYFGDSNPYEELPKLNIFTYNLGKLLGNGRFEEIEDKAFNFREFFRVWTGDVAIDFKPLPQGVREGDFVHKDDVISFLNLISKNSKESNYPYANEEFRDLFKHSLWMLPGVKEAKALSKLLGQHPVFSDGLFDIINVAGDGDDEEESRDALKLVKDSISKATKMKRYTITLSCGKLTTGVTIPEWTAVMMLSGSYSTSAANYLQTIFRVQSPANIDGKIKDNCYVFDFAPDRTLKMVADAVNLSARSGRTSSADRVIMGEFLNFCPVISIDGTRMQKYNENNLLQQLKRAYAERAVKNGFDDTSIYNDIELSKLTEDDLSKFENLRKIVGSSKSQEKMEKVDVNKTGLTDEEYEELEKAKRTPKKERTPEEKARLEELKEKQNNRNKAISNLRAISIRIPLLIYGAEVEFDDDITAEKLVDIVDDASWDEFMPTGISKELFKEFVKYYDADVFIAAGRRIKSIVKQADMLQPTERVQKITDLFRCFKNPDKETVLTPWRVVNMHMSDCLGGYDFFDDEHKDVINIPRYVDKENITAEVFGNKNARILEINSKTGLYPLYAAYSLFRARCTNIDIIDMDKQNVCWEETIKNNVFVICKTPMAKAITKRTLVGYKSMKVHSHYFDDLTGMLKNKPAQFIDRVQKPSYWNLEGSEKVKFDAIIGNPPYQLNTQENSKQATPIYNLFVEQAKKMNPRYMSMIMPSRWFAGGMGLNKFREEMLNDSRISKIVDYTDSRDCFNGVDVAGGICYLLWDSNYDGECSITNNFNNQVFTSSRALNEFDILVRYAPAIGILRKIQKHSEKNICDNITSMKPFGFPTKARGGSLGEVFLIHSKGVGKVSRKEIKTNLDLVDKFKIMTSKASHDHAGQPDKSGQRRVLSRTEVIAPNYICTESYIVLGAFDNEEEANNYYSYVTTKFARFLISVLSFSQDITKDKFSFVPMQDFSKVWTDKQLYIKYDLSDEEIEFIESMIKPME